MACFDWILLKIFLGMSWTYLIVIASRRGLSIVCVVTIIVCCSVCCFRYQLVFYYMDQRYCGLTTNSSAGITCSSIFVWNFLLVNTNGMYMIFQSRLLQHTFKHNTLLFKCINLENKIHHLSHYPWFNTPFCLVSFTLLQKTHIFFTNRR